MLPSKTVKPALVALGIAALLVIGSFAQTAATPGIFLQYSTLSALGDTLSATRVPVVTQSGTTVYKDVVVKFDADADGNLTLAADYPKLADSLNLQPSSFIAGRYAGPASILAGKMRVEVSGPGEGPGATTAWSLSATDGADPCTYPSSATWYTGAISTHPLGPRLRAAQISSTAWSYGIAGAYCSSSSSSYSSSASYLWARGTLIGVRQTGDSLTIASFSRGGDYDLSAPVDQITFRRLP